MSEVSSQRRQGRAGTWLLIIVFPAYVLLLIAFGYQTFQLVDSLFPGDLLFMKIATVFSFDVCATLWAAGDMFYKFHRRKSRDLVFGMWICTFILSCIATAIQMYMSSTHVIPHDISPAILSFAYGLVILAFIANIIAFTSIVRMEWTYTHPYEDDEGYQAAPAPRRVAAVSMPQRDMSPDDPVTGQFRAIAPERNQSDIPLAPQSKQRKIPLRRPAEDGSEVGKDS